MRKASIRRGACWPPCARSGYVPLPDLLRDMLDWSGLEAVLLGQYLGLQKVSNVRKLLSLSAEFSGRGKGLDAFIAYLDEVGRQAVREGEAIVHPRESGAVNLLTIHKAKGLEYPVVFLPDMGQETRGDQNEAVWMHRALGAALRIEGKDGEPYTPALGKAIRARTREEQDAEQARLLYVGMTRARDYLVLCGTADSKGWFKALDEAFGFSDRAESGPFSGKGWTVSLRRARPAAVRRGEGGEEPPVAGYADLAPYAEPVSCPGGGRETFSISAILDYMEGHLDGEEERDEEDRGQGPGPGAAQAMARGTAIHRLFEYWDFAQGTPPPLEDILRESGFGIGGNAKLGEELDAIAKRFRASELHARLAAQARLEREAPFVLRVKDALVGGTIDVVLDDGTVLDYKTGAYHEERHARHEWQLLLYGAAVASLTGRHPDTGLIYYVDEDKVRSVPLGPSQMEAALRHAEEVIEALRSNEDL